MHILQVCNVGNIMGGTAACAWTITHALGWARHTVAFLSPIHSEARAAFGRTELHEWRNIESAAVHNLRPDLVLLHNTPQSRCTERLPVATLQYLHSAITPAPADLTVYCSRWLAQRCGQPEGRVLYQAVPVPPGDRQQSLPGMPSRPPQRPRRRELLVGRICTPLSRKWPDDLEDFYRVLSLRCPTIHWEFVGCPESRRSALQRACRGRARFHEASWNARSHLNRWDALLYHHPTLTESFGRTCAEAMRSGCIPIVDNRGGFREQVASLRLQCATPDCLTPDRSEAGSDRLSGFLCDNPEEFSVALEWLLDPDRRVQCAQAAHARGNDMFSLERFSRNLLEAFRRLAAGTRQAA